MGKRIFLDLLSKKNLDNQELNFWLRAINAYEIYSMSSKTRLLEGISDSTCFNEKKSIFQIIPVNFEGN